jgi:hypothetical protein
MFQFEVSNESDYDEMFEDWPWKTELLPATNARSIIYTLMHTCRQSRTLARNTFRFDHESAISTNDNPFWTDQEDTIYFRAQDEFCRVLSLQEYLAGPRDASLMSFDGLGHIAFDSRGFYRILDTDERYLEYDDDGEFQMSVLDNFPSLKTLTLLLDPLHVHREWRTGRIALYEPEPSVEIHGHGSTAEQVESRVERMLSSSTQTKEVPMVDVLIMLRRPRKRSRR